MIEVIFYNDGAEVKGHARNDICSVVSALTWACANSILKHDTNSKYYTSVNDNLNNPNEGYTHFKFNDSIEKAREVYEQYKHNIQMWCNELYTPYDVRFIENKSNLTN